jgi:hypothetical protein
MTTRLSFLVGTLVVAVAALAWSIVVTTRAPVARNEARTNVVVEETLERRRPTAHPRETVPPGALPATVRPDTQAPAAADEAGSVEPKGPPTDKEFHEGLSEFGANLRHLIVGDEKGREAVDALRELLERAGPERLARLIERFGDDTEEMGARVVIAHVLAQSNDPQAIAVLAKNLRDPASGLLEKRFASHALAFSDADGVEEVLREVATGGGETGARANAAFGLARRGSDEGVHLYFEATDEAFDAGDPGALQYLGGLRLLGDRALPGVRERLTTYTNEQALLVLIGSVKAAHDQQSRPILERLAFDTTQPVSIQRAAQGAIRVLSEAN